MHKNRTLAATASLLVVVGAACGSDPTDSADATQTSVADTLAETTDTTVAAADDEVDEGTTDDTTETTTAAADDEVDEDAVDVTASTEAESAGTFVTSGGTGVAPDAAAMGGGTPPPGVPGQGGPLGPAGQGGPAGQAGDAGQGGQAGDAGQGGQAGQGGTSTQSTSSVSGLISLINSAYGDASLGLHRGHQPVESTLIAFLGISHDEMHVRMEQLGQNLQAVATDLGLDYTGLISALVQSWSPAIDDLLDAGVITEAEATAYRAALTEAFTFRVTWNGSDATPSFTGLA